MSKSKLYTLGVVLLVAAIILKRNNRTYSVLNPADYVRMRNLFLVNKQVYETPSNYCIEDGKLVSCSKELTRLENLVNNTFKDRIPWCLPNYYGNLNMMGPFPSIEDCGLTETCQLLKDNIPIFKEDFNKNKSQFVDNPEKLGYSNHYGRIDILNGEGFNSTIDILNQSDEFVRAQRLNKYAGYSFLSTTFTVLYPGGKILPHYGPSNYKYRIHTCLDIDGDGGIITPYGTKKWKVGSVFILDDSYLHSGYYEGTRPRVILMVDVAKTGLNFDHITNLVNDVNL